MAQQPISMQLTMVSTPETPTFPTIAKAPKVSSYRAIRFVQQFFALLFIAALSWGAYYGVSHYIVKSVKVVGTSMVPTLSEDSNYLLNLWALRNREPRRGEIVVIRDPGYHGLAVKRIVAVAGESVHFKDGKVFVNGVELEEPYLLPHTYTFTYSRAREQFITCGKDQYFVLGDNREKSIDSRAYGPVSRQDIVGLVVK